ncbi:serine hydrolase [Bradyrhizobium elkanii]|uniref:serine hydrolase n=1 Tax=Bradyrhizobium elkanii TaxID=29448 RepID=UPI0020A0511A|nr:serine hydrolase domain-containing protein [Bradyrhizobium elkanii]MCP1968535.1 CubicO group peptidase (beta-lactamase class C family) [Bradyrhizobium elkanii]MCS4109964.1 CubicO group peptidase (beta-lactamase class C family) [Bradyrhizobium elkanii]
MSPASASPFAANTADTGNRRASPHSKWAFRNIDKILPLATIANDRQGAVPIPRGSKNLRDFKLVGSKGSSMDLESFEEATSSDALVVMVGDELFYESYRNSMTPTSSHILMSGSKSVVGLLAGILESEGVIGIARDVSEYVPEIARTAYKGATLRDLLDMRAGVVLDQAQEHAYANAINWNSLAADETPLGFVSFLDSLPDAEAAHGEAFKIRISKYRPTRFRTRHRPEIPAADRHVYEALARRLGHHTPNTH